MPVSERFQKTLQEILSYCQNSWFLSWIIPNEFKVFLAEIDEQNKTMFADPNKLAGSLTKLFKSSLLDRWFFSLLIYCFSGLNRFFYSDLMSNMKSLMKYNAFNEKNVSIVLQSDLNERALEGFAILQQAGIDIDELNGAFELLNTKFNEIIKISKANFDLYKEYQNDFYMAVLKCTNSPENFCYSIDSIDGYNDLYPYLKFLAQSQVPLDLAQAFTKLKNHHLLPNVAPSLNDKTDYLNDVSSPYGLNIEIIKRVSKLEHPLQMTEAITLLEQSNKLSKCTLILLLKAENPIVFVQHILDFEKNICVNNYKTLPMHFNNVTFCKQFFTLDQPQRSDFDYCNQLRTWLELTQLSPLTSSPKLKRCFDKHILNCLRFSDVDKALFGVFNSDMASELSDYYFDLLLSFAPQDEKVFIHLNLLQCMIAASIYPGPGLLEALKTCDKPEALLKQIQSKASNLDIAFIETLIRDLNAPAKPIQPIQQPRSRRLVEAQQQPVKDNKNNANYLSIPISPSKTETLYDALWTTIGSISPVFFSAFSSPFQTIDDSKKTEKDDRNSSLGL